MRRKGNRCRKFRETKKHRRFIRKRSPPRSHLAAGRGSILLSFLIILPRHRLQLFAHIDDFFIVAVNILPDGVHIIKNIIKQVVNRLSFAHIMKCRPVYIFEEE